MFAGAVGTSKTPIAHYLSVHLGLPIFSTDAIRSEVREDTGKAELDLDIFIPLKENRFKEIVARGRSFIFDASIDRHWDEIKAELAKKKYRWFIISMDLSHKFIKRLYEIKNYQESIERLDQLITDHNNFLAQNEAEVGFCINDSNFPDRLEMALQAASKFVGKK